MDKSECLSIEVDAAARVRGFGVCERQPLVSCFRQKYLLSEREELACTPTIKLCRARRGYTAKHLQDDLRVLSDCLKQN